NARGCRRHRPRPFTVGPTGQQQREGADVTLINTDGMSFIGPGSEWFWTALGVIIAAVTLLGIDRQLRLQLGAGAIQEMEPINQQFQSEQMSRARRAVLIALRDGADPAKLPPVA